MFRGTPCIDKALSWDTRIVYDDSMVIFFKFIKARNGQLFCEQTTFSEHTKMFVNDGVV